MIGDIYILDENLVPVPATPEEFASAKRENFRVAHTKIVTRTIPKNARNEHINMGAFIVSTVFLGIEHSGGMLYETMVFEGPDDGRCVRYRTREEAITGHAVIVSMYDGLRFTIPLDY